jgi:hypothetical protein
MKGDTSMPPRNSLRNDDQPVEQTKGKTITNLRRERVVQLSDPDGTVRQFVLEVTDSRPNEDGTYSDSELINIPMDHAGNPLPADPRSVIVSHSGLYIPSEGQRALCTSRLHVSGSRNIFIGQDGRLTPNGAICSRCDSLIGTLWILIFILAAAGIFGVWKGAGMF